MLLHNLTLQHGNCKAIGHQLAFVHKSFGLLPQFRRVLDIIPENVAGAKMHKAISLQKYFGLGTLSGTRRTK